MAKKKAAKSPPRKRAKKKAASTRQTVLVADDAASLASATPPPGDDAWTDRSREKHGKPIVRSRVKELREMPASELKANAKNWREHPQAQREALAGVLADVGFADVILARELDDGGLEIIDGHLRAEMADDQVVPVVILDVTEAEADKLLATIDPLTSLATTNGAKLGDLLESMKTKSKGLKSLMDKLKKKAVIGNDSASEDAAPATRPATKDEHTVIVIGSSRDEQDALFAELAEAGYTVKMGPQKRDPRRTAQHK